MLVATILSFLSVFAMMCAIGFLIIQATMSPRATLERRLDALARVTVPSGEAETVKFDRSRKPPRVDRFIARVPLFRRLGKLLVQAGSSLTITESMAVGCSVLIVGGTAGHLLTRNLAGTLSLALLSALVPPCLLMHRKRKLQDRFTEQIPEVLGIVSRSLRAGHSLTGAIELVAQEIREPAGGLFQSAFDQQRLGLRMTDALAGILERMDSPDLRFFVTAVSINAEVGGNLAETLDKLGETVRERLKIRRQVRIYTAQGRLSSYVMAVLPVACFALLNVLIPGYEDVLLGEKTGRACLGIAMVAQLMGYISINRIITIKV